MARQKAHPTEARALALDALIQVEGGAKSQVALRKLLSRLPSTDIRSRAFATELVYGVLRNRYTLDHTVDCFCSKPRRIRPLLRNILRLGTYELAHLAVPDYAVVNQAVALARTVCTHREAGFVNAVLRQITRNRESTAPQELFVRYSHPAWVVDRLVDMLGDRDVEAVLVANNQPAPLTIRVNTLKISRQGLASQLQASTPVRNTCYSPVGLILEEVGDVFRASSHTQGQWVVQDEAAQLCTFLVEPQPGQRILDACSGQGGKATLIAQMVRNDAEVTAVDRSEAQIERLKQNAERLGISCIKTVCCDLLEYRPPGTFDRILLDPPCSALGLLRRHPEIRYRRKPEDVSELAARQLEMLRTAVGWLAPGGRLVYGVCTWTREETESLAEALEAMGFEPARLSADNPARPLVDARCRLRVWPHRHGMDGFYVAAFQR